MLRHLGRKYGNREEYLCEINEKMEEEALMAYTKGMLLHLSVRTEMSQKTKFRIFDHPVQALNF
jgi:hypothetical protein